MKQEDKELLLKDLCARLPYGVRCKYYNVYEDCYEEGAISGFERKEYIEISGKCVNVEEVKPYLFPHSNMTDEQRIKANEITDKIIDEGFVDDYDEWDISSGYSEYLDFLNSQHIDCRGLIPKGLAIDATGLNIY